MGLILNCVTQVLRWLTVKIVLMSGLTRSKKFLNPTVLSSVVVAAVVVGLVLAALPSLGTVMTTTTTMVTPLSAFAQLPPLVITILLL